MTSCAAKGKLKYDLAFHSRGSGIFLRFNDLIAAPILISWLESMSQTNISEYRTVAMLK